MSKQIVNIGSKADDGTGDSIRVGMNKINSNFNEIYSTIGDGITLSISSDAATLNGELPAYYLNYENFTNIPTDVSEFTNGSGYITSTALVGLASEGYVDAAVSGSGIGITYGDLSVSYSAASGVGTLTYNNTNGTFTFAPADLSGYLTSVQSTDLSSISIDALSDVDTATASPSDGQALVWSTDKWIPQTISSGGGSGIGISYSDLSVSYSAASGVGTLTYNNTNGTFTFAPPDLSGSGIGITYGDLSVSYSAASGVGTLTYNNTNGTFTFTPPDLSGYLTGIGTISGHTDVQVTNLQVGQVLKWDGDNWVNDTDSTGTGGTGGIEGVVFLDGGSNVGTAATLNFGTNLSATIGSGIVTVNSSAYSRTTANVTATSIGVGQTAELTISAAKTYVLYSVQTDYPAWVTLYVDTDSRNADTSRSETTDPLPGSGVVAEVITTSGNLTQLITPGTIGFNNESPPESEIYLRVVNKHDSQVSIAVTVNYLKLED